MQPTTKELINALASATPSEASRIEIKLAARCVMGEPDAVAFFNPEQPGAVSYWNAPRTAA